MEIKIKEIKNLPEVVNGNLHHKNGRINYKNCPCHKRNS
ncbi:hypothetical protein, partial [Plasmodium yoelii yoelii]